MRVQVSCIAFFLSVRKNNRTDDCNSEIASSPDEPEEISDGITYVDCAFSEEDEIKCLGGRWDPHGRTWYVPANTNIASFKRWRYDCRIYLSTQQPDDDDLIKSLGGLFDYKMLRFYITTDMDRAPFSRNRWLHNDDVGDAGEQQ